MQSIEIKAVDSNDFDIWLPLWKGYQRFYEVDIPESVTLKTWARFLNSVEPMHAALAMVGEQALGLVHSVYHRSTWTTSDYCYLQDLFVAGKRAWRWHRPSADRARLCGSETSRSAPRVLDDARIQP
jgi:hypothetical protein